MLSKEFVKLVKDQHSALDKQIATLTSQRDLLGSILKGEAPAVAKAPKAAKAKAATAIVAPTISATASAQPATTGQHKGYIAQLLPFLFERPEVAAGALLEFLNAHNPQEVKRNSLDAAIQNELKKPQSRIERVRPGVYKISAAGAESLSAPANQQEAAAPVTLPMVEEPAPAQGF